MGIQIHAMDNYRRVVELIQSGAIGPVREVHIWNERTHRAAQLEGDHAARDVRLRPVARPRARCDRCEADFHPYNWRRRWAFGSAMLGDIGCHLMDVVFWSLDLKHPTRVTAEGAPQSDDICTDWNIATYEFPAAAGEASRR